MRKVIKKSVFIVCCCFLFFSCASGIESRKRVNNAYSSNSYDAALSYLKSENKDGDLIDLNLDEAMILFMDGKYKESADKFNITNIQMSRLSDEMSVGQMITAGLASEYSIKYAGPAYEYSLLDIMNAFNYMMLGDFDSARAMMRRSFNNNKDAFNKLKAKLKEMNRQSEDCLKSDSTKNAINSMADLGLYYDFQSLAGSIYDDGTDYKLSPFIFYLGAVLFANDRDMNTSGEWMNNIAPFTDDKLVSSVLNIPKGKGSINVVSLSDTILKRDEAEYFLNLLGDLYGLKINFKLTWPVVPKSYNVVNSVNVRILKDDNTIAKTKSVLIEDFDNAVRLDVKEKAEGAYSRSLIRNITRKSAAYIGGIVAVESATEFALNAIDNGVPDIIAYIIVINAVSALQVAMDAIDDNEHADIRQCVFFPSKARAAGIILDPGIYDVAVDYVDRDGRVIKSDFIKNIEVEEGIPSVVPSEYINTGNFSVYEEDNYYD